MTALCGGGTSQPKPGLDTFVTYSAGAIALALQARGGSKLIPLIPLLGLAPLELSNLCSTDPPALPTLTEDEVFALLLFKLDGDYFSGLAKFRDLVIRILWYELCECTTGSPTTFVDPTLPTNTPDPVVPPPQTTTACAQASFSRAVAPGGTLYTDNGPSVLGLAPTMVRWSVDCQPRTAALSNGHSLYAVTPAGAETNIANISVVQASPSPQTVDALIPAGTGSLRIKQTCAGNVGTTYTLTDSLEVYCGGQLPGGTLQPCCPPDASTQAYLDQILGLVTLIQRQAAPFSYVYGTNHTGLTGHGSLAVSGLIGCSVDVTTLPSSYGVAEGSPEEHFNLGYVTLGTADGFETSRRIDHDGSLLLPTAGGVYTAIGYTLSPGVEVSIRELVREP